MVPVLTHHLGVANGEHRALELDRAPVIYLAAVDMHHTDHEFISHWGHTLAGMISELHGPDDVGRITGSARPATAMAIASGSSPAASSSAPITDRASPRPAAAQKLSPATDQTTKGRVATVVGKVASSAGAS